MESVNTQKLIKWAGIVIASLIVLKIIWPFYSVPTGSRGVVTRFGAIVGIEAEGLTVLPPWEKLSIFSIRAETADVQNAEGATSDTQPVTTSLTVRYAIQPDKVSEVFEQYSHDGDLSSYVDTATHEIFKSVTARYDAPDLIAQRPKVSADIYDALSIKLAKYGARVINIDMTGFSFSPTYMAAINDKVTQEQLRLAAENKLKTVEAEQKQKVAVAEAEASAVKATADGDAYARVTNATAEAKAIQVQGQALAQSAQVLELRRIAVEQTKAEKWDGKLPEAVYAGAPIPFLNVGSSK
jgi:prohibitin 2